MFPHIVSHPDRHRRSAISFLCTLLRPVGGDWEEFDGRRVIFRCQEVEQDAAGVSRGRAHALRRYAAWEQCFGSVCCMGVDAVVVGSCGFSGLRGMWW